MIKNPLGDATVTLTDAMTVQRLKGSTVLLNFVVSIVNQKN